MKLFGIVLDINNLRRITSTGNYLPAVDGMRFLAITLVVLCHIDEYLLNMSNLVVLNSSSIIVSKIFEKGYQGVQLFFVISGFIIVLPFIKRFRLNEINSHSLKSYYFRRLIRLEPPYFITMMGMFLLIVVMGKYPFVDLVKSLFCSLTYSHNFFYWDQLPLLNSVAWSLEIEIQFYILAPFLVHCLFKHVEKFKFRVFILFFLILLIPQFAALLQIPFNSILNHLQYFLAGILLCDCYLENLDSDRLNESFKILLASILLIFIIFVPFLPNLVKPRYFLPYTNILHLIHPLVICAFYLTILNSRKLSYVFSFGFIPIIGGMCYSIYLIHNPIIKFTGRFFTMFFVPNSYMYFFLTALFLCCILIISIVFFVIIERPFMGIRIDKQ